MTREKAEVQIGDIIHIYCMFGYPEYQDTEGNVQYIDDDFVYGTWGEDPLIFTDDWEIIE